MPLDLEFFQAVEDLRVPLMGSAAVAPLLYSLVRFTRPRRVLEIGAGYTTPFIARALADNKADYEHALSAFTAKSIEYTRAAQDGPEAEQYRKWLSADPALASPHFYSTPYAPKFITVDDLTASVSSASNIGGTLHRLGLQDMVTIFNGDFRNLQQQIAPEFKPFDFAWVDCNQCLAFFDQYWKDINPQDGLLLFHWLLTDKNGEAILEYIKSKQRIKNDLEIISLWEPYKIAQNSLTLIRKTASANQVFNKSAVLHDMRAFLASLKTI